MRPITCISGSAKLIRDEQKAALNYRSLPTGTMVSTIVSREVAKQLFDVLKEAFEDWPKPETNNSPAESHPVTGKIEEWMSHDHDMAKWQDEGGNNDSDDDGA
jgi:hypothetical protein